MCISSHCSRLAHVRAPHQSGQSIEQINLDPSIGSMWCHSASRSHSITTAAGNTHTYAHTHSSPRLALADVRQLKACVRSDHCELGLELTHNCHYSKWHVCRYKIQQVSVGRINKTNVSEAKISDKLCQKTTTTTQQTDSHSTKHFNYLRRLTGFFSGRQTFHIINTVESVNK